MRNDIGSIAPETLAQEDLDFQSEYRTVSDLDLREYFHYYPAYFRDELQALYDAKSDAGGLFFRLNLEVPSPLVWLLLNEPKSFLLACEKGMVECGKKFKKYASGASDRMDPDEQREIIRLKEEIESYLLDLNLPNYLSFVQNEISKMYLNLQNLRAEEEKQDYQMESIDPFVREHDWMFDPPIVQAILDRTREFFAVILKLYNLLHEQGLFEVMVFEEEGVKF